jgi:cytochrome c-type biogenesis protein CcmH/NrfF
VLLWGAPFFMLALGVIIIWRITRRRASMPLDDDPAPNT